MSDVILYGLVICFLFPLVVLNRRQMRRDRLRWDTEGIDRALDMWARGELTQQDMLAIWEGRRDLP